MSPPFRHRILCALTALSLALFAAPVLLTAAHAGGDRAACSPSDASPVGGAGGSAVTAVAADPGAGTDMDGAGCEPGPCSLPLTTCVGAGGCVSAAFPPAHAPTAFSADDHAAPALRTGQAVSSPVSRHPTPPPRG